MSKMYKADYYYKKVGAPGKGSRSQMSGYVVTTSEGEPQQNALF